MTRIHMDTEVVRETARLLDWTAGEIYYMPPKLKSLAGSISSAWQGGRAGYYASELRRMSAILQREVINLQRLAVRVRNEVNEWENADNNGARGFIFGENPFLLGSGALLPALPAALYYQRTPLVLGPPTTNGESSPIQDWEGSLDLEFSDKWTKSGGWKDGAVDLGVDAKIGLIDGAYKEGEGSSNWKLGKYDIGGAVGEYGLSQREAGVEFGFGEDGFTAGAYGEYDLATAAGGMVLGGSLLGLTFSGSASAVSADGFVGIKDNTAGASIGVSLASGDVGIGLNIAGINIGLEAGLSAGVELGVQVGSESEVKFGPLKIGLNIGKAIND